MSDGNSLRDPDAARFTRSRELQRRLSGLVPDGAHTYARGPDQYPEHMAPILAEGQAAHVWDVDGNRYVEYGMGLRAVTLGHAYEPVVEAVRRSLARGVSFTRPTELELLAAQDFLSLVPGADMVKFAKNGSDATTAAVRLARAATGAEMVAVCADHPFFSVDDWFMVTQEMNGGIPRVASEQTVSFRYNDLASLDRTLEAHPGQIACVVMEAARATAEPQAGFLRGVRSLCDRHGVVLVFDEMITGFRWSAGGAQRVYGVTPDLSCWGKAMGNGFPISALAGRRELMELGGLNTDAVPRTFLLSTTHGPETASLAAFRAVVEAYRDDEPVHVMECRGAVLADEVNREAKSAGLSGYVSAIGRPSCLVFTTCDPEGRPSQAFRALFLQELLRRGVLGQSFVISAAHTDRDIEHTVEAVREALAVYERAVSDGDVAGYLHSRPVAPALRAGASIPGS